MACDLECKTAKRRSVIEIRVGRRSDRVPTGSIYHQYYGFYLSAKFWLSVYRRFLWPLWSWPVTCQVYKTGHQCNFGQLHLFPSINL